MPRRSRSFKQLVFFSTVFLILFTSIAMGSLWLYREVRRYRWETAGIREQLLQYEKELVRREVENVLHFIHHEIRSAASYGEEDGAGSGKETGALMEKVLEGISGIRFGTEGYVFVLTFEGVILASAQIDDPTGDVVAEILDAVRKKPGGTFVEYFWRRLTHPNHVPKISFVAPVPEWEWVIGAGFYLDDIEEAIKTREEGIEKHLRSVLSETGMTLLLVVFCAFFLGRWFWRKVIRAFHSFTANLEKSMGTGEPLVPSDQQFIEFETIAQSLNEILSRKLEAERQALDNAVRFKQFADSLPQVAFELDRKGRVVFANRNSFSVFGFPGRGSLGKVSFIDFAPESEKDRARRNLERLMSGELAEISEEFSLKRRDGSTFTASVHISPIVAGQEIAGARGILVDITENKRIAGELSSSLKEKEVLLSEIHHRTKNNLQIISSILNLQADTLPEGGDRLVFRECQSRVHSMALVHEHLYRSSNLSRIGMAEYIIDLIAHIRSAQPDSAVQNVSVQLSADPSITLNIDKAIPCGILLNEIISNSFKYAFPDGRTGNIGVILSRRNGFYRLEVRDDGVGIQDTAYLDSAPTLGVKLIRALASQLDGSVRFENAEGLSWFIEFR